MRWGGVGIILGRGWGGFRRVDGWRRFQRDGAAGGWELEGRGIRMGGAWKQGVCCGEW